MKLEQIYAKDINRTVNPAVSASDFSMHHHILIDYQLFTS